MQRIQNSWRIYPTQEAAQAVLDQMVVVEDEGWTFRIVMLQDGVRCVIGVFDEDGIHIGNLP